MEPLSDDYVAEILKKDAQRKDQSRYLSAGLGSLLGSSRPRSNAPKPNTRFLRNIVREADSHNAALRKKEEEESRERMRRLRRDQQGKTRDSDRERRRDRDSERRRHRSRSRSPRRERDRHRSRKEDNRRRRSAERDTRRRARSPASDQDSDSDPLDSAIGPRPPPRVQARGRGANSNSAMDSRFDPNYDPKADVSLDPDEDGDDWDMALEALRDRAKWRKSGAERLRAAGFTDDEVAKWEKGGSARDGEEKDISDVRWNKKGEGREWDRGKTFDGDRVDVKAEWGRLKND